MLSNFRSSSQLKQPQMSKLLFEIFCKNAGSSWNEKNNAETNGVCWRKKVFSVGTTNIETNTRRGADASARIFFLWIVSKINFFQRHTIQCLAWGGEFISPLSESSNSSHFSRCLAIFLRWFIAMHLKYTKHKLYQPNKEVKWKIMGGIIAMGWL